MKKDELVFELHALDVDLNPKWTVEELRSLLREQREARGLTAKPTGLTTKNLAQLTDMATRLGMRMPAKPTRGLLMRMIRDMDGNEVSDETVVTFGRFRGFVFKDVPTSYTDWAIQEVEASDNADPQLTQMANWAAARKARMAWTTRTGKQPLDPEAAAKIKPPPMDAEAVPVAPPKPTASAAKKTVIRSPTNSSSAASTASFEAVHQTGTKGRRDQNPAATSMPSPEAIDEVQELEQQLALARQKHGMTVAHQPEANGAGGGASEMRIASDDELASEAPARTRARGPAE
jgi:hypothetical protein